MSSTTPQLRQPEGAPNKTGGQFAEKKNAVADDVAMVADVPDAGEDLAELARLNSAAHRAAYSTVGLLDADVATAEHAERICERIADPNAEPEYLATMLAHPRFVTQALNASGTTDEMIAEAYENAVVPQRIMILSHERCPASVQDTAVHADDPGERITLARRADQTRGRLFWLAGDTNSAVQRAALEHPNADPAWPAQAWDARGRRGKLEMVRAGSAEAVRLGQGDEDVEVRLGVLSNARLSPEQLSVSYGDADSKVRTAVMMHQKVTPELIEAGLRDPAARVRTAAQQARQARQTRASATG
jgi:hypothetical protein